MPVTGLTQVIVSEAKWQISEVEKITVLINKAFTLELFVECYCEAGKSQSDAR